MPRPIIVAASIAAVLVLGACGNTDANEDDVHDILTDADATEEQADCAAGDIAEELTQDELNDLASADSVDDIPEEIDEKVTPILDRCLGEGGPTEEEPEGEGDTSDTTEGEGTSDTTEAEGTADTTTTTAAAGGTTTTTAAG